jgi:hypothetical protein
VIRSLLRENAAQLFAAYLFVLLEQVCFLIRPMLFGRGIEELVRSGGVGAACAAACANEAVYWVVGVGRSWCANQLTQTLPLHAAKLIAERGLARRARRFDRRVRAGDIRIWGGPPSGPAPLIIPGAV